MGNSERKWATRLYRNGDEQGILELWQAVYPERDYHWEPWLRWWRWMYQDNPNGAAVIYVAEHDGRIVGHAAEIPITMKIGNEVLLVGLGADALTHPEYRRQGIYVELVRARRAEGERRGMPATYSFPNELSYPAMLTRGLTSDIAVLQKVMRPLNWRNALRTQTQNRVLLAIGTPVGAFLGTAFFRAKKTFSPKDLTPSQVSHFDDRIDELWRRVSSRHQVIVVRNKRYLNWRYASVPDVDYLICVAEREEEIAGYLVISRRQLDGAKVGIILDVFAESEQAAQCLVADAVARCRQQKIDLVYGARVAGTTLATAYRRNGFLPTPLMKPIRVTGRSASPDIASQLLNQNNWFLQIGDSDRT